MLKELPGSCGGMTRAQHYAAQIDAHRLEKGAMFSGKIIATVGDKAECIGPGAHPHKRVGTCTTKGVHEGAPIGQNDVVDDQVRNGDIRWFHMCCRCLFTRLSGGTTVGLDAFVESCALHASLQGAEPQLRLDAFVEGCALHASPQKAEPRLGWVLLWWAAPSTPPYRGRNHSYGWMLLWRAAPSRRTVKFV